MNYFTEGFPTATVPRKKKKKQGASYADLQEAEAPSQSATVKRSGGDMFPDFID